MTRGIAILSIFRDSLSYLDQYLEQIGHVCRQFDDPLLVWLEGDSVDGTHDALERAGLEFANKHNATVALTKYDTGHPYYPSTEMSERWEHLTDVWNTNLATFRTLFHGVDWAVSVEADLQWNPRIVDECIVILRDRSNEVDAVAAGLWHRAGHWYDTNGFRKDGRKFTNHPPYIPGVESGYIPNRIERVDSIGGLVVSSAERMAHAQWADTCRLHWPTGTRLGWVTNLRAIHP